MLRPIGGTKLGQFLLCLRQELALCFGQQSALFDRLERPYHGFEIPALIDPDLRQIPQHHSTLAESRCVRFCAMTRATRKLALIGQRIDA